MTILQLMPFHGFVLHKPACRCGRGARMASSIGRRPVFALAASSASPSFPDRGDSESGGTPEATDAAPRSATPQSRGPLQWLKNVRAIANGLRTGSRPTTGLPKCAGSGPSLLCHQRSIHPWAKCFCNHMFDSRYVYNKLLCRSPFHK
jgi:hypothetical protein